MHVGENDYVNVWHRIEVYWSFPIDSCLQLLKVLYLPLRPKTNCKSFQKHPGSPPNKSITKLDPWSQKKYDVGLPGSFIGDKARYVWAALPNKQSSLLYEVASLQGVVEVSSYLMPATMPCGHISKPTQTIKEDYIIRVDLPISALSNTTKAQDHKMKNAL